MTEIFNPRKTNIPRDNIKDYMTEYGKQYYASNQKEIKRKRQQKMKCSRCGCIVSKQSIYAHRKTKKCLNVINTDDINYF